jgi:putative heme-binding domain-containing protein
VSGGHYGWQNPQRAETWRLPPYFLDVVAPVATLGRGSPTGVVFYRHTQFPEMYRGGLFLLDWTFGRVYFLKLERKGASYTAKPQVFLEAVGDNGFAPTAAAVHPLTGDLYLSIGGRGTRGAVYRVRYPAGLAGVKPAEVARLQPAAHSLDWQPGAEKRWLEQAAGPDLPRRLTALALIRRHRTHFSAGDLVEAIKANWSQPDRSLRQATAALIAALSGPEQDALVKEVRTPVQQTTLALGRPGTAVLSLIGDQTLSPEGRLDAVRLLQRQLGDVLSAKWKGTVWEGYSRRDASIVCPDAVRAALRSAFPAGHADLDRELSRTLALIEEEDSATLAKVAAALTPTSHPIEDIHYLIVLARLRGPRPPALTRCVATALLALDRKIRQRRLNRDSHWPLRIAEMHAELVRKDPALNAALLDSPDFGRPDHVLFTRAPGFDRRRAAEVFLTRSEKDVEFPWNAELVKLLGTLPEARSFPVLRRLWGQYGVDEAILPLLARHPDEADRSRFVAGLGSVQSGTLELCLGALDQLPVRPDQDQVLGLILALRRLPTGKEQDKLRERLHTSLKRATGKDLKDAVAWTKWYVALHPDEAARLSDADGVDVAAWSKRLAALDWSRGDAERGRGVFTKASCASCHSGTQALGPDLQGVAGRFSRDDLFTAILQPSKDVSPRYRTTQIVTADGKLYQGLIVYEAVDSVILQTGPATTQRVTNRQISERHQTTTSLMPAGLLDKLSDREIADLYAYLKTLSGPKKRRRKRS